MSTTTPCSSTPAAEAGWMTPPSTRHTELLTWQRLPGTMPDADQDVLLSVESSGEQRTWPGYWDGEQFVWADGMPVAGAVLGWAQMPEGVTL